MASIPQPTPEAVALHWQDRRVFLVAVTAAAGFLDTLAFVYLGKVFISFMSGNLLFLGIAAGQGDGGLLTRAAVALAAFLLGSAVGAKLTGSRLSPDDPPDGMYSALLVEAVLLALFGIVWAATGPPSVALIAIGAGAMGVQAAVALALHLPNVATVAMTATLAQLGALAGWREREGARIVGSTPSVRLMLLLCLAYLVAAAVVATIPESPVLAFGPMLLVVAAATGGLTPRRAPARHAR